MVFGGSAYWNPLGWWQTGAAVVVSAYDRGLDDRNPRVVAFAYLPEDVGGWKLWSGLFEMNLKYRGPDPSCQVADKLAADLRDGMRRAKDGQ